MVGYPNRDYMWLLSRGPSMDRTLYRTLIENLRREHYYDTSKVCRVPQKWTSLRLRDREASDSNVTGTGASEKQKE